MRDENKSLKSKIEKLSFPTASKDEYVRMKQNIWFFDATEIFITLGNGIPLAIDQIANKSQI